MKLVTFYTSSLVLATMLVNCGQDADPGGTAVSAPPVTTSAPVATDTATAPATTPTAGPTTPATTTQPTVTMSNTMAPPTPTDDPTTGSTMTGAPTGMVTMAPVSTEPEGGEGGAGGDSSMEEGGGPNMPPATGGAGGEGTPEPDPDPVCGDGMMAGTEACDDGNMDPADGCEPDCTVTPEPAAITIETLVPDLEGHLVTTPCGDQPDSDDCAGGGWSINGGALNVCQNGQLSLDVEYPVGGEPGVLYDVTMHFYGVMEPRQYNQATRDAAGGSSRDEGGTPTPWAYAEAGANYRSLGDNNYNTYEIHVYDQDGNENRMYFLNSDSGTGHYTLAISYEKTIPVIGGGKVQLIVYDANCRMIKNCGPSGGPGNQCGDLARTVDISAADPQPAANTLQQPGLGNPPQSSGQWWLIDVLSVQEAAAQ